MIIDHLALTLSLQRAGKIKRGRKHDMAKAQTWKARIKATISKALFHDRHRSHSKFKRFSGIESSLT